MSSYSRDDLMNGIENIKLQIAKVDKIIYSIKEDISKDPDDKISPLNLKTFERMKRGLLFQIELEKDMTLEEELKLIQDMITKNKDLQKEDHYNKKELESMLKDFKKYENKLLNELNQHTS